MDLPKVRSNERPVGVLVLLVKPVLVWTIISTDEVR